MSIVALVLFLLLIIFLIYKRSLKLTIIFLILFFGIIGSFLCMLDIEDYYGRNNHVFFNGKQNDTVIILDRTTEEHIAQGQILKKSWNRVFIKSKNDTLDLNEWIEQKAGYMADVKCELK